MPSIDTDLDAIFSAGDFDVPATFTLNDDTEICVRGFFTDATEGINLLTNQIEAVAPSFMCSSAKLANVDRGNAVEICGTAYTVAKKERTGTGATLVHLKT
jgi:hypothetical protein